MVLAEATVGISTNVYPAKLPLLPIAMVLALEGCGPGGGNTVDAGADGGGGEQLFNRALEGPLGIGAMTSVWTASTISLTNNVYMHRAYIAAGMVGVPPEAIPAGGSAGTLVGFDATEHRFESLCQADFVLRAVYGVAGRVYAAGDSNEVIVYDARRSTTGERCSTLTVGSFPAGESPSLRAIVGDTAGTKVFFGGSVTSASGTRPLLYGYDGQSVSAETIPTDSLIHSINDLSYKSEIGFWAVGDASTALHFPFDGTAWLSAPSDVGTRPDLLSVASESQNPSPRIWTMAVGDATPPLILRRQGTATNWEQVPPDTLRPQGTATAVYLKSECEAVIVGRAGMNLAFNARAYVYPTGPALTNMDLSDVSGSDEWAFAVGGDTSVATPDQPAVVLVRGRPATASYAFGSQVQPATQYSEISDNNGCGPQ